MRTDTSAKPVLFACAAAGITAYGIAFACLGAAFGATGIGGRIHASLPQQGSVFLLLYGGVLISNLLISNITLRFGRKTALLLTNGLLILALSWFAVLHTLVAAQCAAFALGFGGGSVNVSVNSLVSDIFPERRAPMLNLLGVFFGVGALLTPLLSTAASTMGVSTFFQLAAILPIAAFLLTSMLRLPPAAVQSDPCPFRSVIAEHVSSLRPIAAVLFFENGNEAVLATWTSTIAVSRGSDHRTATIILTLYWLFLMLGRLAASQVSFFRQKSTTVRACAAVSLCGGVVLLLASDSIIMMLGASLIGLASAPIFKTTLSMAGDLYPGAAARLYGPLFALSLAAAAGAPWLAGRLAQSLSLNVVPLLPIFGTFCILALSRKLSVPPANVEHYRSEPLNDSI
jgi:fucose permease